MAFDSARGVTVLFGGYGGDGGTWEWDGRSWQLRSSVDAPAQRYAHAMAFDENRRVTVLHGGRGQVVLGDTWEWDGFVWLQRVDIGTLPRFDHAMAYASDRRTTFLVGGMSGVAGSPQMDMWEWDGSSWQAAPAAPTSVRGHALVHDRARGVLVLFGGVSGPVNTWEFATCGDTDGDGVIDPDDACPNSDLAETVVIHGCDSGVANHLFDDGCTMADRIGECAAGAENHRGFVRCIAHLTHGWAGQGIITFRDGARIRRCAAQADLPQPHVDGRNLSKGESTAPSETFRRR